MKPDDAPAADDAEGQKPARKAYQKPELQVYGALAQITRSVAGSMASDGAGHPNKHFTT